MTNTDGATLRARASRSLAGGMLHHLSATADVPPVLIARGASSRIWDADGREFIDYYLGSAALVLGHAHREVTEAVRRQLELGNHLYELSSMAIDLAELVTLPCPAQIG